MKIPTLTAALAISTKCIQGQNININHNNDAYIKNKNNNFKMLECTKKIMDASDGSFEMEQENDLQSIAPPVIEKRSLNRCEEITKEIDNNPKLFEKYSFPVFYGTCLVTDLMEEASGKEAPFDMSEEDSFEPNCEVYKKELKKDHPNFFNPSESKEDL